MTHVSEDQLLEYALEVTVTDEERASIATHIQSCPECKARLETIRADMEVLGSVRPGFRPSLGLPSPRKERAGQARLWARHPLLQRGTAYAVLRATAFIVVGFVAGLGASSIAPREPLIVSSAYIEVSPPGETAASCAVSDATGVSEEYYEQVLGERR